MIETNFRICLELHLSGRHNRLGLGFHLFKVQVFSENPSVSPEERPKITLTEYSKLSRTS